jgi:hypothetical protein
MTYISKKEAAAKGETLFFTGRPCKRGHVAKRYVTGGQCLECEKLRDALRYEDKKKWLRERYASDPVYRAKMKERDKLNLIRYREQANLYKRKYYRGAGLLPKIARTLVRNSLLALYQVKSERTQLLLGYTTEDLRQHLESKFLEGMCWENYGEWHVDHIKPISAFAREGITSIKEINALTNLQPLWASENLSKGDRYYA